MKTLLVGGPKHGEVVEVEDHRILYVDEVDSLPVAGYVSGKVGPLADVHVRRTIYSPQTISFFKVPLQVHVHQSIEHDEKKVSWRLAELLLSEKGKQIVRH